jgi:hypothetical protein
MDTLIAAFDAHFASLHCRSVALVSETRDQLLFQKAADDGEAIMKLSVSANIVRSAAIVEMNFGGITTRLWDDPFEWTLPEALNKGEKIDEYLHEVEAARRHAFEFFSSDADLSRMIPAPRDLRSLGEILIDTLARAEHYQGRAFALSHSMGGRGGRQVNILI